MLHTVSYMVTDSFMF